MITRDQLKKGVAYRVIEGVYDKLPIGEIVYLEEDDDTDFPFFSKKKTPKYQEEVYCLGFEDLELAEPEKESMQTEQQLKDKRRELLAEANKITGQLRKRKNEGVEEEIQPKYGEIYYFIGFNNEIVADKYYGDGKDAAGWYKIGNFFHTEKEAKSEAMRRESMKRGRMPKKGETVYYWEINIFGDINVSSYEWSNDRWDIELYYLGRIHFTEKDRDEHCEKYSKYWVSLEV